MLLNPMLAPLFGINKQILNIDETPRKTVTYNYTELSLVNPKLPDFETKGRGGFVKGPGIFMVTRDLVVTPMSSIAVIELINQKEVPSTSLEVIILNLGEAEALNLLKASLTSNNALNAFALRKKKSRRHFA